MLNLVSELRQQFPALSRVANDGNPLVFLDGPAGTQVPQRVVDAITDYLVRCNANRHGHFITAHETEAMFDLAGKRYAEFMGVTDPDEIVFGPNMTTLTFQMSRAISQMWQPGDEIVLTHLDHDANVSPWVLAARDRGVTVRWVRFRRDNFLLDLDSFRDALSEKTRLVAFGAASNATGGLNPVAALVEMAQGVGAVTYVDAVHLGPHRPIQAARWNADFVVCSAYKFFGPHVGVLWGRRGLLEEIPAYKVRPASERIPEKWMQGTQNHEGIAGAVAAVEYLQQIGVRLGAPESDGTSCLQAAFSAIQAYENQLSVEFLQGLKALGGYTVFGVGLEEMQQANSSDLRVSTFSIRHERYSPRQLAQRLAAQGILCWEGNYYALQFSEQMGFEPDGMLRIGLMHYNTVEEVHRLLAAL